MVAMKLKHSVSCLLYNRIKKYANAKSFVYTLTITQNIHCSEEKDSQENAKGGELLTNASLMLLL